MESIYGQVFSELILMLKAGRESCEQRMEVFTKARGAVLNLGDERYNLYSQMVGTNEMKAVRKLEQLAVSLFQQKQLQAFSLYPLDPSANILAESERSRTRPFQIVLNEDGKRIGIVFCVKEDERVFYQGLIDGKYQVDSLRIVKPIDPSDEGYETLINVPNNFNKRSGLPLDYMTINEFWEKYFGSDEFEILSEYINAFNEKAREIIGFSTIVTPTESALKKFRDSTGKMLCSYPYNKAIPNTVYKPQVDIFYKNYIDRGLWKAMVGESDFAISFITSEWNFQMYQFTENLDLTSVVAGYLKSVEQLLWCILSLEGHKPFKIKSKQGGLVEFSVENEALIDNTLGALEKVIEHNSWLFEVNYHARTHLIETVKGWRNKYRNGYFHKHNLQSMEKATEIREQALNLYFLLLGGCVIEDEDFVRLGIK